MRFWSEDTRLKHPQAASLPRAIWLYYFLDNTLSDLELEVMREGMAALESVDGDSLDASPKIRLWHAYAYAHPDEPIEGLMAFATRLKINRNDCLTQIAVPFGNRELFEEVMTQFNHRPRGLQRVMAEKDFEVFRRAAHFGHLAILNRLIELVPREKHQAMFRSKDYEAFRYAAKNGHLEVLNRLIELVAPDERQRVLASTDYEAFRRAAENGHLEVLNRLIELVAPDECQRVLASMDYEAFRRAAENGHLEMLNRLIELVAPDKRQPMLLAYRFYAFRMAAKKGHLEVLNRLIELVAPDECQHMLASEKYQAFCLAAQYGHLEVLNRLIEILAPDEYPTMLASDNYQAFRYAAENGHLEVLNRLIELLAPDKRQAMLASCRYLAFRDAAENGHLEVLNRLIELLTPHECQLMLASENYRAFHSAAKNGHLEVFNRLIELLTPDECQLMLASKNYQAFQNAAKNGHLEVLNRLIELVAPDKYLTMLDSENYRAFYNAAKNGHLSVLNCLIELMKSVVPDSWQAIFVSENYVIFHLVAQNGHLEVLNRFIELLTPAGCYLMLMSEKYQVFRYATQNGHLEVFNRLIELLTPEECQRMLASDNYQAFCLAAQNGHLEILNRLLELVSPERLQSMLTADNYRAFQSAAANSRLPVVNRLLEVMEPWQTQRMIAFDHFSLFQSAVGRGRLSVVKRYLEVVSPGRLQDMLSAEHFQAFQLASTWPRLSTLSCLLQFSLVFEFAEAHDQEYGEKFLHAFVTEKVDDWWAQKETLRLAHEDAVFDLNDPEEARLCFYMVRNLIRRYQVWRPDAASLLADLDFLLAIPAVRALAATAVTPGIENELLQLALAGGHPVVIQRLLAIPAVRELAARHAYYEGRQSGQVDLRALARDAESSVRALSPSEEKCLNKVREHYQPQLERRGVSQVMAALREALKRRYEAKPAMLVRDEGTLLALPLAWHAFQALGLSVGEAKRARQAYHAHQDHTAWRYVLKPNPWLSPEASYVCVDPVDRRQRWADFEPYEGLIALLYLAVKDEQMAPVDGYTLEGRVTHFIDELAHIARAHNWDKTRQRQNADGTLSSEEYDDTEEGDRPSCYSGMKKRLFQSVQGHPVFCALTQAMLKEEIRGFVWRHFDAAITDSNRAALKAAWEDLCIDRERLAEDREVFAKFTIPETLQTAFIKCLIEKHGESLSGDPALMGFLCRAFALKEEETHAETFAWVGWDRLLTASPRRRHAASQAASSSQATSRSQTDEMPSTPRCSHP